MRCATPLSPTCGHSVCVCVCARACVCVCVCVTLPQTRFTARCCCFCLVFAAARRSTLFKPELIKSQFNHIFAVVSLVAPDKYTLKVRQREVERERGQERGTRTHAHAHTRTRTHTRTQLYLPSLSVSGVHKGKRARVRTSTAKPSRVHRHEGAEEVSPGQTYVRVASLLCYLAYHLHLSPGLPVPPLAPPACCLSSSLHFSDERREGCACVANGVVCRQEGAHPRGTHQRRRRHL